MLPTCECHKCKFLFQFSRSHSPHAHVQFKLLNIWSAVDTKAFICLVQVVHRELCQSVLIETCSHAAAVVQRVCIMYFQTFMCVKFALVFPICSHFRSTVVWFIRNKSGKSPESPVRIGIQLDSERERNMSYPLLFFQSKWKWHSVNVSIYASVNKQHNNYDFQQMHGCFTNLILPNFSNEWTKIFFNLTSIHSARSPPNSTIAHTINAACAQKSAVYFAPHPPHDVDSRAYSREGEKGLNLEFLACKRERK